ncbi:M20 family metallo-hydrolase [Ferroplasma sp.]|uniref:M20 family metallo-hydrolase n=1 Tax=Ferroplasma sp. TaxID=2591003 RepID=UPI00307D9802
MNLAELSDKEFIEEIANRLLSIKAVSPKSDGKGEYEKSVELKKILNEIGYNNVTDYNIKDNTGVVRPNIVLKIGNFGKTLWIICHIDTVPEGDIKLWKHEPYKATIEEDKIYGRGSEDNGQAIFTVLLLLRNLETEKMKINLGIAFVSDEETGNDYGIKYIINKDIFNKNDLIIVPDAGTNDGNIIETAEKTVMQLKFQITGKQGHASMPESSINAFREASKFLDMMDFNLHEKFNNSDKLFIPPYSTFEPTKHEKNIDNVNTIPGTDVFYWDFRVLPQYSSKSVIDEIDELIAKFSKTSKAKIAYGVIDLVDAPAPTSDSSEVVVKLKDAIRSTIKKEPFTIGIGGETFASFLRSNGFSAAVWSTTAIENAHMPDEFCLISHIIQDLAVYKYLLYN